MLNFFNSGIIFEIGINVFAIHNRLHKILQLHGENIFKLLFVDCSLIYCKLFISFLSAGSMKIIEPCFFNFNFDSTKQPCPQKGKKAKRQPDN